MTAHSRFAPSSAEIWMNCDGALNLIDLLEMEGKIENDTNEYAAYGTVAHDIAADCLNEKVESWERAGDTVEQDGYQIKVDEEMIEIIDLYVGVVRGDLQKYGGTLHVEERSIYTSNADLGGTLDAGFLGADDVARIYDLKTGFKYVDEEYNKQLMIYAVLFLMNILNTKQSLACKEVEIVIVQPRCYDGAPVRRWRISKEQLAEWEATQLDPALDRNAKNKHLTVGPWCTKNYCNARHHCEAFKQAADSVVSLAQKVKDIDAMNNETIGEVLRLKAVTLDFFDAVEKRAYHQLMKNKEVPGQKLVRAKTNRQWIAGAADSVPEDLEEEGFTRKIKTPAQFEKLGPKAKEFAAEWAKKPEGDLTMAAASDKRPAERAPEEDPSATFGDLTD